MCSYQIKTDWRGQALALADEVSIELAPCPPSEGSEPCFNLTICAPYHDDPPPPHSAGSCPGLWDYEVVEVFILGEDDAYLEMEFGPHSHYLVLQFQGERRLVADALPLPSYTARLVDPGSDDSRARGGRAWVGEARVPHRYLPPPIRGGFGAAFRRFNAYGISGQGQGRRYAALFPAQGLEAPDFHRLRFFERLGDGALGG